MPGIINCVDFVFHLILKNTTKLIKHYVLGWVQSPKCNILFIFCYSLKEEVMDE